MTLKITGTTDEVVEFLGGLAKQPLAEIETDFFDDYNREEEEND